MKRNLIFLFLQVSSNLIISNIMKLFTLICWQAKDFINTTSCALQFAISKSFSQPTVIFFCSKQILVTLTMQFCIALRDEFTSMNLKIFFLQITRQFFCNFYFFFLQQHATSREFHFKMQLSSEIYRGT